MIKRILVAFVLIFFVSHMVHAQKEVRLLTLDQLLDSVIKNNYLLQGNEIIKSIKNSEIDALRTNYLLKINTSASFSYWKFLLPNKEKLLGGYLTDMYTDISIYQPIYSWGEKKLCDLKINN